MRYLLVTKLSKILHKFEVSRNKFEEVFLFAFKNYSSCYNPAFNISDCHTSVFF